ncbi:hypothetical protein [Arcobacter aquimarinus]|uniref:Uncharacterized protein n=1 Tax=Arcobacter aquimarinus TaxID=1315211 RepID=A0AAE7E1M1_9BACT|nr:hypothetical protein [Arcobacter aquimarinus]QKE26047.1 hypothetical protein AAQM_1298 [Arcobacter aquimarinus]
MAKHIVTQKLNLKGVPTSSSFQMEGDDADVTAVCSLLEGGYEVKKVDEALSDMTGKDTLVSETNPVTKITLNGPQNQFSVIRPFSGVIHFKQTAQVEDIKAALSTSKPFALLPTETPTSINVVRKEYMA